MCSSWLSLWTRVPQLSLSERAQAPPEANVTESVRVRMRSGAWQATSCAIAPPIE